MPCNNPCPCPVPIEETILSELRNLYAQMVARLEAIPTVECPECPEGPDGSGSSSTGTPIYEWRTLGRTYNHGGNAEALTYSSGTGKYKYSFDLPHGVVFLSCAPTDSNLPDAGDGVWFPGNLAGAVNDIDFQTKSAALGNFATVVAPAGGEIPSGHYDLASTVELYEPIITYLVRV